MPPTLPAELKLAIAESVRLQPGQYPRMATLQSLSLVSSAWSTAAQIALFHRIEMTSSEAMDQIVETLLASPSLARYVQEMELRIYRRYTNFLSRHTVDEDNGLPCLSDILDIISLLPNLAKLSIEGGLLTLGLPLVVAPSLAKRRRLEVLQLTDLDTTSDALDSLFCHFAPSTLRILGCCSVYPSHQGDSGDTQSAWSFDDSTLCSTVQRLEINRECVFVSVSDNVSALEPFSRGTPHLLNILECPLLYSRRGLTAFAALLENGLGCHLTELSLIFSGYAKGDMLIRHSYADEKSTEQANDAFGPIPYPQSLSISLATACPHLKFLSLSLPLFSQPLFVSMLVLPEWQYALRLITSANPFPLTRITIRMVDPMEALIDLDQATIFGKLNWNHLDAVLDSYAALRTFEIVFTEPWNAENRSSQTATLPASFKLDEYLEEQMPGCAARGLIHVGSIEASPT
ncbi:hypothetical protein EIP91_008419 [Steccherinum ochraceum]|uniref:F-box domain-containing protein n=1 Tax=Steccherinum ochraceum TaxID=92696 RepID=A0A4R0R2V4_9APHY|nr:hypothetical protein EIP91_008419 [Steccherinum ochraceum]